MGRTLSSLKSDEATLTSDLEEKQNTINQVNKDLEELKAKKDRVNKQVYYKKKKHFEVMFMHSFNSIIPTHRQPN